LLGTKSYVVVVVVFIDGGSIFISFEVTSSLQTQLDENQDIH
jgi:hypothetical protein